MQQCAECNKGLLVTPLLYCFIMHTMFHAGRPAGRPARQQLSDGGAAPWRRRCGPVIDFPLFQTCHRWWCHSSSLHVSPNWLHTKSPPPPHLTDAAPRPPRNRHVGSFVDVKGNAAGWRLVSKKCQLGQNVFTCGIQNCKTLIFQGFKTSGCPGPLRRHKLDI